MEQILDILRNLPEHLQTWATLYGTGLYLILALIIFAETGLVVTPFLPGDSLLFATGAVLAMGIPGLNVPMMCLILIAAAFCGDMVNYQVGRWVAPKVFGEQSLRWLNRKHLERTREFYARHGGKTVILARFLPIVRTYAPFVAGVTTYPFRRFVSFSLLGGALWIVTFVNLGYFFGNIPAVKRNFELVIVAIIFVSLIPAFMEFARRASLTGSRPGR